MHDLRRARAHERAMLRIQQEKDHTNFLKLVEELSDLIATKEHRFPTGLATTISGPYFACFKVASGSYLFRPVWTAKSQSVLEGLRKMPSVANKGVWPVGT